MRAHGKITFTARAARRIREDCPVGGRLAKRYFPMHLTHEQEQVVRHAAGHAIVGAVAGSGKTATMVQRIVHLVQNGTDPGRILSLMFNKSARDSFEERLAQAMAGLKSPAPRVFTFHSFGMRLCAAMEKRSFLPVMRLVTEDYLLMATARKAMARVNQELPEDNQIELTNESVSEFLAIADLIKGHLNDTSGLDLERRWIDAYWAFEEVRREDKARTFTDLIFDPVMAMLKDPEAAAFAANRYDHIIVDEMQDINEAQMRMLRFIAGTRAAVMGVGDEDQTIYAWRGAKPEYMTRLFAEEFTGARRYQLSRTFRYGHALSLAANHVISQGTARTDKICVSGSGLATALDLKFSAADSGKQVIQALQDWIKSGRALSEVAILVREYSMSIPLEMALIQAKMNYAVVGAPPFYHRREVQSLLGWLELACGGLNDATPLETIEALLTFPTLYLRNEQVEALVALVADNPPGFRAVLSEYAAQVSNMAAATRTRLMQSLEHFRFAGNARPTGNAAQFLNEMVRRLGVYESIRKANPREEVADEKKRMVWQILQLAKDGQYTIRQFYEYLKSLAQQQEQMDNHGQQVLITSVHRAKGLEWSHVILPDLSEGRFPSYTGSAPADDAEMEDERRLFYVAMTRAKERLTLIAPVDQQLITWVQANKTGHPPPDTLKASRFLYDTGLQLSVAAADALLSGDLATAGQLGQKSRLITRYLKELGNSPAAPD
jgi:DNA helicase II / ATP-dependent DNA helicase PcrA